MNYPRAFCFLGLLSFSTATFAGQVHDVFKEGVFGLAWGASVKEVQARFPNGALKDYSGIQYFETKEQKTLFQVQQRKKDKLIFSFDTEGRMAGMSAEFNPDDFAILQQKLQTEFPDAKPQTTKVFGGFIYAWPDDNGIVLTVTHAGTTISISIGYSKLPSPSSTKEDLGFN